MCSLPFTPPVCSGGEPEAKLGAQKNKLKRPDQPRHSPRLWALTRDLGKGQGAGYTASQVQEEMGRFNEPGCFCSWRLLWPVAWMENRTPEEAGVGEHGQGQAESEL